jgi:hypothetical protein
MITADEIFTSLEKEFVLSPAVEPGAAPRPSSSWSTEAPPPSG